MFRVYLNTYIFKRFFDQASDVLAFPNLLAKLAKRVVKQICVFAIRTVKQEKKKTLSNTAKRDYHTA